MGKGRNLIARSGLWDLDVTQSPQFLTWRAERPCLFLDSGGYHRKFWLHLPLNFAEQQLASKKIQAWPMMLYLHGTGGSSFFTHSKKTLKSHGLQFAASRFVVVS